MLVYFVNHSSALDHLGGAERSLINLVEDWYAKDPDFEAFFITKAPRGRFVDALERRGWKYKTYAYRGWANPLKDPSAAEIAYFARADYRATEQIIATMEHRRPDLVVTNTVVAPWGAFGSGVLGIPHAWFVREYGDLDHGLVFQVGRDRALEDIGLLSTMVFANSMAIKQHLGDYVDPAKVTVVYPQVRVDRITELAQEDTDVEPFPGNDAALKVAVVGRLTWSKGQWRVVDAIGELAARGVRVSVCFVGARVDADHDLKLLKRARELGVEDAITFADEQENPFPFIAAADVCITPSGIEAFGRTTLEYLVLGKPVIATEGGGSAELVSPGENGYLFDPEDISALATHLETYATDPALIRQHGSAALERAALVQSYDFSNAAAIDRLKTIVEQPAYRLPNIARYWFSLPRVYSALRNVQPVTAHYLAGRVKGMARNFIKHPIQSVRRRLRR